METRSRGEILGETEEKSSEILDLTGLKGKVTEARANLVRCSDHPPEEEVYRARHPWSLYDVPAEELEKGMDRLRKQLPGNGWKIVKDGTDGSRARTPQLVADFVDGKFSADIRFLDEREHGDDPSLLEVTVVSACHHIAEEPADDPA
ncbi:MAG TPA: hypothetical protein VFY14_10350 [Streptomyces sp.]|nr:hypothetical protein [Streptomyces sp.]